MDFVLPTTTEIVSSDRPRLSQEEFTMERPVPVMPLAMEILEVPAVSTIILSEPQIAAVKKVGDDFVDAVTIPNGSDEPQARDTDKATTLREWSRAQRLADDQLKAQIGAQAWMAVQAEAHQAKIRSAPK
jgi:hypothetical protein